MDSVFVPKFEDLTSNTISCAKNNFSKEVSINQLHTYVNQDCKCLDIYTSSTTVTTTTTTITTTTTTTTTKTTTNSITTKTITTSASSCGSPQWANDKWCDDENNNAACNFDAGACCNNDFVGWDTFCQVSISTLGTN